MFHPVPGPQATPYLAPHEPPRMSARTAKYQKKTPQVNTAVSNDMAA